MTNKIKFYLAVTSLLGVLFMLGRCNRNHLAIPKPSVVLSLPKEDKERVSFNEKTHTLTVQTQTQTIKEYAKNPSVEIRKDGSVKVSRNLIGFENEPFLGGGYADTGRIFLGDNIFHVGRCDLVGGLGWTPDNRFSAVHSYVGVGYNLYHNTSFNVACSPESLINKNIQIAGFVSVRL